MWSVDTRIRNYRITAQMSVTDTVSYYSAERVGASGFTRPLMLVALHTQLSAAASFSTEFVDAASLFARVPEDRFVPVEDVGSFDSRLYCVTPFYAGWTLARFLEASALAGETCSLSAGYFLVSIVADALAILEHSGRSAKLGRCFHGDVSPTTVIVGPDGRVRLRMPSVGLREQSGSRGSHVLSARAPEQRRGERGDARADVFALGALLWTLVNKGSAAGKLHPGIRELVMRALSVEPAARPVSAAAFRDELCVCVAGEITEGEAHVRTTAIKLASRGVLRVTTCDVSSELDPTTALFCRTDDFEPPVTAPRPVANESRAVHRVAEGMYMLPPQGVSLRRLPRRDAAIDDKARVTIVGTETSLALDEKNDRWVIGRGMSADLALSDPDVSREHCELIRQSDGCYAIYDLGSKNGVYVNEKRSDERVLSPGDEIRVGNTRLRIHGGGHGQ